MSRRLAALCAAVFLASILTAGCGDDGESGGITGPSGGGNVSCRNYESEFSTSTTGPNGAVIETSTGTCTVSTVNLQVTCTTRTSPASGPAATSTSIWSYGSLADLVNEVAVLPPRRLALSLVVTSSAAQVATTTFFYDASDRLTREASLTNTTVYTEWDDRGRPTVGTTVGTLSQTLAISYNDAARIRTTAVSSGGQLVTTCRDVFDTNGNQISRTCTDPGGATTTTRTITSTQRVCK